MHRLSPLDRIRRPAGWLIGLALVVVVPAACVVNGAQYLVQYPLATIACFLVTFGIGINMMLVCSAPWRASSLCCDACGYDLRGTPVRSRCPECGTSSEAVV